MAILYNQLRDNFTQIPNELLTDDRLSNGAKVVYCYVASKPTGWKFWNTEIQKALNIKDNNTMSKYWKELLNTGWVDRTRTKADNGQFSGGYDYELRISPNTENDHIRENPSLGKTPTHSNTDFNINTNIINNTNILDTNNSNNISLEENIPKGQLFSTNGKPKKQGENQYNTVIEKLSSNPKVRTALQKYLAFRRKKGLTIEQWETIVTRFKNDTTAKCKSVDEAVDAIEKCLMDGNMKLFYKEYNNKNYSQLQKVTPANINPQDDLVSILEPSNFLYQEFYFDLPSKPTKLDPDYMPALYLFADGSVKPEELVDPKYKN